MPHHPKIYPGVRVRVRVTFYLRPLTYQSPLLIYWNMFFIFTICYVETVTDCHIHLNNRFDLTTTRYQVTCRFKLLQPSLKTLHMCIVYSHLESDTIYANSLTFNFNFDFRHLLPYTDVNMTFEWSRTSTHLMTWTWLKLRARQPALNP